MPNRSRERRLHYVACDGYHANEIAVVDDNDFSIFFSGSTSMPFLRVKRIRNSSSGRDIFHNAGGLTPARTVSSLVCSCGRKPPERAGHSSSNCATSPLGMMRSVVGGSRRLRFLTGMWCNLRDALMGNQLGMPDAICIVFLDASLSLSSRSNRWRGKRNLESGHNTPLIRNNLYNQCFQEDTLFAPMGRERPARGVRLDIFSGFD